MNNPIYCIGGATVDRKFKSKSALLKSTSNPVVSHFSFGGVARNVAVNLSSLTEPIHFQSVIGSDSMGERLLIDLVNKKIGTSHCLILPNQSTAHYYAILDHTNDLYLGLADMEIFDHIPYEDFIFSWQEWKPNSIVFLDTNLPSRFIEYAIELATKKQIKLCIDPVSVLKVNKLPYNLMGIYLLKPNQLEASKLTGILINSLNDSYKAAENLKERGVKQVIISLGKNGYIIANDNSTKHYCVEESISILDANGAGDAFISGILLGLQQEFSIEESCQIGSNLAAKTLQTYQSIAT
jgi:pseudouridine kinase